MAYPYEKKTYRGGKVTQYKQSGDLLATSTVMTYDLAPGAYNIGGVLRGTAANKILTLTVKSYINSTQSGTVLNNNIYTGREGTSLASFILLAANAGVAGMSFGLFQFNSYTGGSVININYGLQVTIASSIGTGGWEFELTATEA